MRNLGSGRQILCRKSVRTRISLYVEAVQKGRGRKLPAKELLIAVTLLVATSSSRELTLNVRAQWPKR